MWFRKSYHPSILSSKLRDSWPELGGLWVFFRAPRKMGFLERDLCNRVPVKQRDILRVLGLLGFRVSGFEFRICGLGFCILGFWFGLVFWVSWQGLRN